MDPSSPAAQLSQPSSRHLSPALTLRTPSSNPNPKRKAPKNPRNRDAHLAIVRNRDFLVSVSTVPRG